MKSAVSYLKGYVRIRFWCEKPERFLNLCAHHRLLVTKLLVDEEGYSCQLPLQDFWKLKNICRKTHTKVRVTGKYGLPFFFSRNKKRKAFFIGILLSLALIGFLSTRVWNIHIEGNYSNSTQMILRFLKEKEICHGIAKKEVNCSQIAAWIRKEYGDITWVSAKLSGTRLLITIQENDVGGAAGKTQTEAPCNLVADKNGTIVKMITRAGVPAVAAGMEVKKGDLLVGGTLEILDDAQEVVRYEYVHADADIYLMYTFQYQDSFPLEYEKRIYTGNTKNSYFFQVLNKRISLGLPFPSFETYDAVSRSKQVYLTENFLLPIIYGKTTEMEYRQKKEKFKREEAYERADETLTRFLEKLLEKGVQICENSVKIEVSDSVCKARGSLVLMEKIGKKQPITQAQPEERNDGERNTLDEQ